MNTPGHAVLNLAILGRRAHPEWNSPVAIGAVLPDVPIFLLWAVATFVWRQPQHQIWSETYFLPGWQVAVDVLHSFPLLAVALVASALLRLRRAQLLTASMLLHACGDVFLHGADAHRQFFPFSNYRFVSTVSYWDPAHYGSVVLPIEALAVIGASMFVWRIVRTRTGRGLLIATDALYLAAVVALALLLKSPGAHAANAQQSWSFGEPLPDADGRWTARLRRFVSGGEVDYAGWKKEQAQLDDYLRELVGVKKEEFAGFSREHPVPCRSNSSITTGR